MQLVSDVRNGVPAPEPCPAPEPSLLVTLRIPGFKRRRETDFADENSKSEDDVGAEEVHPNDQK